MALRSPRRRSQSPRRQRSGSGPRYRDREASPPRNEKAPPRASNQPDRDRPVNPPLPNEPPPGVDPGHGATLAENGEDGWEPVWEPTANAFYFYNRITQATQWQNPRVPDATQPTQVGIAGQRGNGKRPSIRPAAEGGYNPAIHGDFDPNADYARPPRDEQEAQSQDPYASYVDSGTTSNDPNTYGVSASFNRFTGKFQNTAVHPTHAPDAHTDEVKSKRQLGSYYDVDAAANAHDGRSLKEERRNTRMKKGDLKKAIQKKKDKKAEKKRAWLLD